MLYKRQLAIRNAQTRAVRFGDFSNGLNASKDAELLPLNYAKSAYNFSIRDGALKEGLGIDDYRTHNLELLGSLTSNVVKTWLYKRYDHQNNRIDDALIAYCENKMIYYCKLYASGEKRFMSIADSYFSVPPTFVNYRLNGEDCLIACSEKDNMMVWNGYNLPYRVPEAPKIASMAIHYERLFAIAGEEDNTIWFSGELDPTMWTVDLSGAGFITLTDERGALRRVVSFLDYVYIFRDYGITRLTGYGDQTQFNVSQLFVSSGKINPDTITVCGDRIIFLASDGLYSFDGINTTKLMSNITPLIHKTETASAAFNNNKYYLACKFDYQDNDIEEGQLNTIIEIDLHDYSATFLRGADTTYLSCIAGEKQSEVLLSLRSGSFANRILMLTNDGRLKGEPMKRMWHTGSTDFGRGDLIKTIRDFYILSKHDCTISIVADNSRTRTFDFKGKPQLQRIRLNIRGRRFAFSFGAVGEAEISNAAVTVIY